MYTHPSPLPPDPIGTGSGSPLPQRRFVITIGSPLPPDVDQVITRRTGEPQAAGSADGRSAPNSA